MLLFVALQAAGYSGVNYSNDSYRYARSALQFLGQSGADAQQEAVKAYCANRTARGRQTRAVDPDNYLKPSQQPDRYRSCLEENLRGLHPRAAAYERIFETRPGYPLVVAPGIAAFGVLPGMWVTDLAITLAASLLFLALLRAVGASPTSALAGQILYLAGPLAYWSMRPLTEGLVNLCTIGAALGGWWLLRGRTAPGAAVLVGSLAVLALTKYSTAMMLAAAFAAAGVALTVRGRRAHTRLTLAFTGLSLAAAACLALAATGLSLPTMQATLQDTFTGHFDRPAVTDPWQQLLKLNLRYWPDWLVTQALNPLFAACAVLGGWALLRRADAALSWLCLAVAAVGLGSVVVHPVADQGDRLWLLAWVPAALGTVLWLDRIPSRAEEAPAGLLHGGSSGTVPQQQLPHHEAAPAGV